MWDAEELRRFCRTAERRLSDPHVSLIYDGAVIKLYAAFERMMIGALTGAIGTDTSQLSATTSTSRTGWRPPLQGKHTVSSGASLVAGKRRQQPRLHYEVTEGIGRQPRGRFRMIELTALDLIARSAGKHLFDQVAGDAGKESVRHAILLPVHRDATCKRHHGEFEGGSIV